MSYVSVYAFSVLADRRMGEGDEEYGKKMYEAGIDAATQPLTELILKLKPYLSPDGLVVLGQEIRNTASAGKKAEGYGGS